MIISIAFARGDPRQNWLKDLSVLGAAAASVYRTAIIKEHYEILNTGRPGMLHTTCSPNPALFISTQKGSCPGNRGSNPSDKPGRGLRRPR